jgi:PLP dependent protein
VARSACAAVKDARVRITAMSADTNALAENLARVSEQIARAAGRAGRQPEQITLVAISKTFPAEAICAAYDAGVRAFGENRVQEFEAKRAALHSVEGLADGSVTWHLIGHLQSNKARRAAELFDRIDSVDGVALARKLDAAALEKHKTLPVLIEVNIGLEKTKSGVGENDLVAVAKEVAALEHLELLGLMTVPPFSEEPEGARPHFRRLRELRDLASRVIERSLPVLSMGMSHDFEIAIEEGATEVRIGTAIFGERPTKR